AEYRKAPEVTRQRLYLDSLTEVFSNSSKVLLDAQGSDSLMYLPLDQMFKGKQPVSGDSGAANRGSGSGSSSSTTSSAGADDGGSGRSGSRSLYQSNRTEIR
ncbi:MAG TPA: protease modulator HflK, partial [Alcanivorax sp.]|nr:protease modulator HflK [Alcanivorax sp.]